MLRRMRTTINLPDALAREIKARAAAENRTVTSLVEEGLRIVLARADGPAAEDPLPGYGEPGDRFLIDPRDRAALWAALEPAEQR